MQIRKLCSSDDLIFQNIRLRALKDHPEAFSSSFEEESLNSAEKFRKRLESNPESSVLGVFDDQNQIRGMLGAVRLQKLKTRHQVDLWGTYVDPSFRGQGAAKALIAESLKMVKVMDGVEQVSIGVVTANLPAKKLYESFGFKVCGIEPRALKVGDHYHDIEKMILYLAREAA